MGKSWKSRLPFRNCASVSLNASSMPTPSEATVALSAVAVTDEMLALWNVCQLVIPKKILQPSSLMRQATNCQMVSKGEIIVSGPAASKGYMNNPLQKCRSLLSRIWRSASLPYGDVHDDEGLLYGGRMDFQSSLNGYRIWARGCLSKTWNANRSILTQQSQYRVIIKTASKILAYVILKRVCQRTSLSAKLYHESY